MTRPDVFDGVPVRGIGGGRVAFVRTPAGATRKVVETGTGVVFVQRCDDAGMPRPGFHVPFATFEEALETTLTAHETGRTNGGARRRAAPSEEA